MNVVKQDLSALKKAPVTFPEQGLSAALQHWSTTLIDMKNNLVRTPVVDKNGKLTTVHKRTGGVPSISSIPKPSLRSTLASMFGRKPQEKTEEEILLESIETRLTKVLKEETLQKAMKKITSGSLPDDFLDNFSTVLDRSASETDDKSFIHAIFNGNNDNTIYMSMRLAVVHINYLEKHPGSLRELWRIHATRMNRFDANDSDIEADAPVVETHLRAQADYTHREPDPDFRGHQINPRLSYTLNNLYFEAVEKRPEQVDELMALARNSPEAIFRGRTTAVPLTVYTQLPEYADRFSELMQQPERAHEIVKFLYERGLQMDDAEAIKSYIETTGVLNDGWL